MSLPVHRSYTLAVIAILACIPSANYACAQTSAFPASSQPLHHVETSVSLGAFASLAATRIANNNTPLITESLSPSDGALATFRQSFSPWLGYSVNFGYTRSTYHYTTSTSASNGPYQLFVPSHVYETSVSYIAQRHLTPSLSVFGEAGAGALGFAAVNPSGHFLRRSNAFQPEAIAGFGVDYRLAYGLGVRAQYRGLFLRYPYPDDSNSLRLRTVISEPTLSLTYTFGRRSR